MTKHIKNFIIDNNSICREERQYAVFLYDILRKYKKIERDGDVSNIFDACSIPKNAEIEYVFYEPTFMRDFFERDRENGFNNKLLQYVYKDWPDIKSLVPDSEKYNLGRWLSKVELWKINSYINPKVEKILQEKNKKKKKKEPEIEKMIQHMMNVKPDIAVIYSEKMNEKIERKLLFLECKFESPERGNQRAFHWLVADFLCSHYLEEIEVADEMKTQQKSCLVKFVRNKRKKKREIEIEKLIAYSYWI